MAYAAMISSDNVLALKKAGIHYIVGARLDNVSEETFKRMDQELLRQHGQLTRLTTDNGFLICSFSQTRFRKDKHEMEKQIRRAIVLIQQPSKNRKTKLVKAQQQKLELNQELIHKTTKLLGVKEPIRLHILICFMALAVSKFIELKTNTSLRAFLTQCKKITDARLLNKLTGKVIKLRSSIPDDPVNLLVKLGLPH